jgi:ribosomal protein S18 acetylase RimI-like enzyme
MGGAQVDVIIEMPERADIAAMAQLFKQDMDDLGVEVDLEELKVVAEAAVEGGSPDNPDCLCWVARLESGGDALGVVLANFNWSLKFAGRALWIEELYVAPEARRRGIGRMLVERVLDYAEAEGIRGVDLEAYRGNTPASILYRSLGFYRLGRERFYYKVEGSGYL